MRHTEITLNGHRFRMPAISLGAVWFGTKIDRATAFALMDAYAERGGTWLDTARVYGTEVFGGGPDAVDSEVVVGEWLRARGMRERITLVTKGAHKDITTEEKRVNAAAIEADMATSLEKLGLNSVDIYFLHNDDENAPVEEVMPALHQLVRQGKTRAIGASNWPVRRIAAANRYAAENGLTPFSISQVRWSYALPFGDAPEHAFDMELDPSQHAWYSAEAMPVMAYSTQARGLFIKTAKHGFEADKIGRAADYLSPANIKRAQAVHRLARQAGIAPSAAGFSWLWGQGLPVTALASSSTVEDLLITLADNDFVPSKEEMEALARARD